jgi:L-rhamnose mutarotase
MKQRITHVTGIHPERIAEYRELHDHIWPEISGAIKACHIENYSIHLREFPGGAFYLFSYYEYAGTDFEADMARLDAHPKTKEWLALCEPCQLPLANRTGNGVWASLEEVFRLD